MEKTVRENAFDEKKKRPWLKFNPGLALIGLRTTEPSRLDFPTILKISTISRCLSCFNVNIERFLINSGMPL